MAMTIHQKMVQKVLLRKNFVLTINRVVVVMGKVVIIVILKNPRSLQKKFQNRE